MKENIFKYLIKIINDEYNDFNTLVNADNTLGINVTIDEILNFLEFTSAEKMLNNSLNSNIIITEGDVLSVLKVLHDLVYYEGDFIIYINQDNVGTVTYLINLANKIYKELNYNINVKIDYSDNYNQYVNSNINLVGSEDFVNTAKVDFPNSNLIIV